MRRGRGAEQKLRAWLARPTLVLGIGHPWCGDDALGPQVCAAVDDPRVVDCGDAPERFLGMAAAPGVAQVLLLDAIDFGGRPGQFVFCEGEELTERAGTTHTTGLAVLSRFLMEAYGTPVAALGVQPADTRFGAQVTPPVAAAMRRLAARVRRATRDWPTGPKALPVRPTEREATWTPS
jgi:hydrogenase 3 maturation protease